MAKTKTPAEDMTDLEAPGITFSPVATVIRGCSFCEKPAADGDSLCPKCRGELNTLPHVSGTGRTA